MTAKKRLLVLGACLLLVVVAAWAVDKPTTRAVASARPSITFPPAAVGAQIPPIAIAYGPGGRGAGLNELASEGAKRAADALGADFTEVDAEADEADADRVARLGLLAAAGYSPIILVGPAWAGPLATLAPDFPGTWFCIVDDGTVSEPNVIGILFNEEQGAFLVGAAAALTSTTRNVGFLGGDQVPFVQKLEAGYAAGARAIDPDVTVQVVSLPQVPDAGSTSDSVAASEAVSAMFDAGADVIFAASGDTGGAVIKAAHDRGLWAIGAGTDHYRTSDPSVRDAILTSTLKHADVATYAITMEVANRVPKDGNNVFGLGLDAVGYSASGGFVDPIKARLDAFAARIASGEILVPTKP